MEKLIGKISHYYSKIKVGIIELTEGGLKVGDKIHIKGNNVDFEQVVGSIQSEHEPINEAKAGDIVGVEVKEKVYDGNEVYKIS